MKPKIYEVVVKYIGCKECGFERGYPLPEKRSNESFYWKCPQCDKKWISNFSKTGDLFVKSDTRKSSDTDVNYILLETNENFIPWILIVQKKEEIKFSESKSLILFSVMQDKTNNPRNFPQYKAVLQNAGTLEDKPDLETVDFLPEKFLEIDFSE